MSKFRKKPVVIDAIRWDGRCTSVFCEWMDPPDGGSVDLPFEPVQPISSGCLEIDTLEGKMIARAGDWIIRGVAGEFYPCKPDIFAATYEEVAEANPEMGAVGPS